MLESGRKRRRLICINRGVNGLHGRLVTHSLCLFWFAPGTPDLDGIWMEIFVVMVEHV